MADTRPMRAYSAAMKNSSWGASEYVVCGIALMIGGIVLAGLAVMWLGLLVVAVGSTLATIGAVAQGVVVGMRQRDRVRDSASR